MGKNDQTRKHIALRGTDDNLGFIDLRVEGLYIYFFSFRFCSLMLQMEYSVIGGWRIFSARASNSVIGEIKDTFPTRH